MIDKSLFKDEDWAKLDTVQIVGMRDMLFAAMPLYSPEGRENAIIWLQEIDRVLTARRETNEKTKIEEFL